ncbi:MAG: hypothetical protein U9Q40_11080 [Campylobacterota bacterium]|nr:hypothetical protein [Campylobacterota bacterium]
MKKIIKPFKIIGFTELLVIATYFISFEFFINLQVAFATSLFVILGASYAYKKMVKTQVESKSYEDKRDLLDDIEDPHELYSEEIVNETPAEELDLKKIVKEEKAKIKTLSVKSMKHGAKGSFSAFRVVPYIFLALGFIALENNELLNLAVYLPSLLVGIVVGSLSAKELSS